MSLTPTLQVTIRDAIQILHHCRRCTSGTQVVSFKQLSSEHSLQYFTYFITHAFLLCLQIIRCRSKENIDGYATIRLSLLQTSGQSTGSKGMTRYITSQLVNSVGHSPHTEVPTKLHTHKKFPEFYGTVRFIILLSQPTTCPYHGSNASSPRLPVLVLKINML